MGHYSYPENDDRELRFDRLMAELECNTKAGVLDAAMIHLEQSIQNHREWDGDPETAKAFATSVIRPHYRTSIEVKRP